jgi:hypothetical protein
MLGHRSLKTGEQHYNHARQVIAQRRYQADLLRLIDDRNPRAYSDLLTQAEGSPCAP